MVHDHDDRYSLKEMKKIVYVIVILLLIPQIASKNHSFLQNFRCLMGFIFTRNLQKCNQCLFYITMMDDFFAPQYARMASFVFPY